MHIVYIYINQFLAHLISFSILELFSYLEDSELFIIYILFFFHILLMHICKAKERNHERNAAADLEGFRLCPREVPVTANRCFARTRTP